MPSFNLKYVSTAQLQKVLNDDEYLFNACLNYEICFSKSLFECSNTTHLVPRQYKIEILYSLLSKKLIYERNMNNVLDNDLREEEDDTMLIRKQQTSTAINFPYK